MESSNWPPLGLATSRRIAEAVLDAARRDGQSVSVAVVDNQGHDLVVLRDDSAWFTAGVARAKARIARDVDSGLQAAS